MLEEPSYLLREKPSTHAEVMYTGRSHRPRLAHHSPSYVARLSHDAVGLVLLLPSATGDSGWVLESGCCEVAGILLVCLIRGLTVLGIYLFVVF